MNCPDFDLKGYLLGELSEPERRAVNEHAAGCGSCGEALERLQATHRALLTLEEEEIPRRIAFVSDKVFEPRWWHGVWRSGPRLGFASAALLAVAIIAHGLIQPPAASPPATMAMDRADVESVVRQVMAASEADVNTRQDARIAEAVAASEKRLDGERRADMKAVEETFKVLLKKVNVQMAAWRGGSL